MGDKIVVECDNEVNRESIVQMNDPFRGEVTVAVSGNCITFPYEKVVYTDRKVSVLKKSMSLNFEVVGAKPRKKTHMKSTGSLNFHDELKNVRIVLNDYVYAEFD